MSALPETAALVDAGDLIDRFLREQQRLTTAVTTFSRWHDARHGEPLLKESYRSLLPLSRPEPDEQYAFEVDLDVCSGCKACVAACHSLNGLDEGESWRQVGQLHRGGHGHALQQTVTAACHHCADPACSNGCPTLAYHKDEETGIVRHLDDQCIGCQYCVLKCPYDVPKYNDRLGIVRKCDMCHGRLAAGEAPACVQSCPNQAIRIVKVKRRDLQEPAAPLVPGAFDSAYTKPATRYLTENDGVEELQSADACSLRVEHAHLPLAAMLVLTQSAVGVQVAGMFAPSVLLASIAAAFAALGLASSVLHLGRPLQAWRAFLGWRKSWLSREIIAFGAWFPFVALTLFLTLTPALALSPSLLPALQTAGTALGLLAVFCSIMVYVDTRRPFWSFPRVTAKFLGSTAVIGAACAAAATSSRPAFGLAVFFAVSKMAFEIGDLIRHRNGDPRSLLTRSARVMWSPLGSWTLGRFAASAAGLCLLGWGSWSGVALLLAGEGLERILFFRASTAPRMPGTVS